MTDRLRVLPSRFARTSRTDRGRAATFVGALVAVLALLAAGCSGDELRSGEARVLAGGTLEVADDGDWVPVAVGETVPDGARLRTGASEARLELRSGEVWLAPSSMVRVTEDLVDIIRGDVLVASGGVLGSRWGDLETQGEGIYRLVPGVAPALKVYDGEVAVARHGEARDVPRLRQLALASSRLPAKPVPIGYDRDDAWDRLLLPGAVAFDAEVERLSRGIDRQHGVRPREPEFYETFAAVDGSTLPLLAATSRIRSADGRFGPPSDALVTLFVAEAVADRNGGDLETAARGVADLRASGARWGAVALERGITSTELARVVDLAQDRRLAAAPEEPSPSLRPEPASPAPPATGTPSAGTAAPTGTSSAPAPGGTSPAPSPRPNPAPAPPPSSGSPSPQPEEPLSAPTAPLPEPAPVPEIPAPAPPPAIEEPSLGSAVGTVVDDVLGASRSLLTP